jgi:hypothetical protein
MKRSVSLTLLVAMLTGSGKWNVNPAGRVAAGNYCAKTPPLQQGAGAGRCLAAS